MNKEVTSWKSKKLFEDITPFTLLDFEKYPSIILWFKGCNMRCDFCYNTEIVNGNGKFSFDEIESFLNSRKNLIKGVVLCGGEPTIHKEIIEICKILKNEYNFKVKLDTNGLNSTIMKNLLKNDLIDYVALDFKSPFEKFKTITKSHPSNYKSFIETLRLLNESKISFEVRTTFHDKLLSLDDIYSMLDLLERIKYRGIFYIQDFILGKNTFGNLDSSNGTNLSNKIKKKYSFKIRFRNF